MSIETRILERGDEGVLARVRPDVFDLPVRPELVGEFLADPRHHLAVAIDDGVVVASVSAVTYIHPDKPARCWINEVSTAAEYRRRGIAAALTREMIQHARSLGCGKVWVITDEGNAAARALYSSVGGTKRSGSVLYEF